MISKQGECDSSSIYLSILYINVFTFSDLNNWDQNLGMFDRSVAYRERDPESGANHVAG